MRAWSPPSEVEEYRLVKILGRGAMGTVWLAHDRNLDRAVAIKVISEASPDETARDRFFVEARAVARLHHPNVVAVFRVGEIDGHPYLVSEYVRGTTLDRLPRPVDGALGFELALGLARGLAAAHRHGVLHRDVKPANAILTEEREVKLLDFGLAKLFGQHDPAAWQAEPGELSVLDTMRPPAVLVTPSRVVAAEAIVTNTEAGAVMGTPAYLAPEVWQGQTATAAADVYALGATLFHLLADRLPHTAGSAVALAALAAGEDAPLLRAVRPDCPPALAEVIDACLMRDPAHRLPDGEAVREALEQRARAARRPALPEGNPYRGLAAFGAEHRHLFFGRELEISDVLERLRGEAWVVVAGRSGAGKSSLLRAGVLPRIVDDGALTEAGGPRTWRVLALAPGPRPRAALVAAAAALLGTDEAVLARALDDDPGALARQLRAERGTGTAVLIDQLEELVTLSEPGERAAFVEALRQLLVPAPAIRVLATLRSDYIGHLEVLGPAHRELTRALFVLGPMTPEGVHDAVAAPAAAHGVSFEAASDVEALVGAVLENPGSLPLVEFALAKLWELRDPARKLIGRDALAGIGGVEGALARHADEVLASLSPGAAAEARRLLLRLVTAERTRARRSEDDLVVDEARRGLVHDTLEALVRGRLLAAGDGTYEVAHEALITHWPRLRLWLDEEQGAHQVRERLEVAAADWERLGRRPEALWTGRRLEELTRLDEAALSPRERAFAATSRAADRRRRWSRRLLLVAAPTLLFGTILGVQAWNRHAAEQRAAAAVAEAERLFSGATDFSTVVSVLRRTSFAAFDHEADKLARALWARTRVAAEQEEVLLDDVQSAIDEALAIMASYRPARRLAADVHAARFLLAERDGNTRRRSSAEKLIRVYDADGRYRELLEGRGVLRLSARPARATVSLFEFVDTDGDGRIEKRNERSIGVTPVEVELPMGSYLLELRAPGFEDVLAPFKLARGATRQLSVSLPRAGTVPVGFVYVPGGPFLVGSQNLSPSAIAGSPLRERTIGPYIIARQEVTFAEWIEYFRSLPADARGAASISDLLSLERDGSVAIDLVQLNGPKLREGHTRVYTLEQNGRDLEIDWRRWPVFWVSRDDAVAYAQWLATTGRLPGARLCTSLEWELAARGADGRRFPQGEKLEPRDASYAETNGADNAFRRGPDEVGSYPGSRSIFGLDDVAGNVFEWVVSPARPHVGLIKGGSWRSVSAALTAEWEYSFPPTTRTEEGGFRLCADLAD